MSTRNWSQLAALAERHGCTMDEVGIVVVDHGSRRDESNSLLPDVARQLEQSGPVSIVEPAHMELVEPSIRSAFRRCADRGAKLVVVSPFFLSPGRHWNDDIPNLTAQAAAEQPGVKYLVAAPLAPHPLLIEILWQRIEALAKPESY